MNRLVYILTTALGLVVIACDTHQKKQTDRLGDTISSNEGQLNDSLGTFYSSNLLLANEQILSKDYLGYEIYRFDWFRSFHGPVFISIYKNGNDYWLSTKKLDKSNFVPHGGIEFSIPEDATEEQRKAINESNRQIRDSKIQPRIEIDKEIKISKNEWHEFERLLNDCNYWKMEPQETGLSGLDGAHWIIEAHLEDKYWFVDRWSPKDNFRTCGEYLIRLSGLHE